jgi:hypothetical protein
VRVLLNDTNSGSGYKQWVKGVQEARGEYVWIAESDDYADVRLLERLMAQLTVQPNVGLAYCQSIRVGADGSDLGSNLDWTKELVGAERWHHDFITNGKQECATYLCLKNTIPNASAVVFRRDLFLQVGGPGKGMRLVGDWILWIEMLQHSDLAYIAEPLNYFRMEPTSVTHTSKKNGVIALESYQVAQWVKERLALSPPVFNALCDIMFYVWVEPQLLGSESHLPVWYGAKRNFAIYKQARLVDPQIDQRIRTRLRQYGTGRLVSRFPRLLRLRRRLHAIRTKL